MAFLSALFPQPAKKELNIMNIMPQIDKAKDKDVQKLNATIKALNPLSKRPAGMMANPFLRGLGQSQAFRGGLIGMQQNRPAAVLTPAQRANKALTGMYANALAMFGPQLSPLLRNLPDTKLIGKAKRKFGMTKDFKEAGYILPDGKMLDFSGIRQGSMQRGVRQMDHSEIQFLKDVKSKYDFLDKTNAIRYSDFGDYIYLGVSKPLTDNQIKLLEKRMKPGVQVDIDVTKESSQSAKDMGIESQVIDSMTMHQNPNIKAINLWIKRALEKQNK